MDEEQDTFKVGDTVYLKSGSPPLTVTGLDYGEDVCRQRTKDETTRPPSHVKVQWFANKFDTRAHEFPPACLTKTAIDISEEG
jgi:uncharacterized protein YodC (DUF2158 family)